MSTTKIELDKQEFEVYTIHSFLITAYARGLLDAKVLAKLSDKVWEHVYDGMSIDE